MKRSDTGHFCVIYIEPMDARDAVFQTIAGQQKPVVLMLAEQVQALQRPEDFTALKHVKRQLAVPIMLVIPRGEHLAGLAARNGFPVYPSMEALTDALTAGQLMRSRMLNRTTESLSSNIPAGAEGLLPDAQPSMQFRPRPPAAAPETPLPETRSHTTFSPPLPSPAPAPPPPRRTVPLTPPSTARIIPPAPEGGFSYRRTTPLAAPPMPEREPQPPRKRTSRLRVVIAVLSCLALAGACLGSFLTIFRQPAEVTAPPTVVGHVYLLSSGQVNENNNQGLDDQVEVDLGNIPAPAPHNSYYAWLLSDKQQSDTQAILLGALQMSGGKAHLFYSGDQQHTNLLAVASRLLVTEEDAIVQPITPSPDGSKWRFYGEFSQTPIWANDPHHYSYLDHLRHLLAADPTLDEMELPGGLNNWSYINMGKIIEWTTSTREHWEETNDVEFVRRQSIRTLAYLDGLSYIRRDLPNDTPLGVDERLARVGLLDVAGPNQDPPSYLEHIAKHLNGLIQGSSAKSPVRQEAADIITALNNARYWLTKVHQDALQLATMSDAQLRQQSTLTLINDIIANANNAYVGQADLATGQMRQGIVWAHNHMQALATMNVTLVTNNGLSIQMIAPTKHVQALAPHKQDSSPTH